MQAVQTLMTALADAILPHLLTPGGRWGSTRAITQAPSTAGSLVVHMGPPHIIFFGVNLESRVEIRIAGLSGGSPVALTAPPVRTPSGQLVVRNRYAKQHKQVLSLPKSVSKLVFWMYVHLGLLFSCRVYSFQNYICMRFANSPKLSFKI